MARQGRPKTELVLTVEEGEILRRWARRPTSGHPLALRCRIVMACAQGKTNQQVAAAEGVHQATVGKWRARFVAHRLDGLHDEPRPGAPRTIDDADVERVLVKTFEESPRDATHWSTRSMASATGMSQTAISKIWRAFGLGPHLAEGFTLSADPQFIDKVRDIAGLYLNPPDAAVVLCVEEKTQIQPLDRTGPVSALLASTPSRRMLEDRRNGITNLHAALDQASGKVISEPTDRRRAEEFRGFVNLIERTVPAGLDIHVIVDGSSTHRTPAMRRWLLRHPRFRLHLTPTRSSWINQAERWFAELSTTWLHRGTEGSTKELVASIRTWIERRDDEPRPFAWHKSADEILEGLAADRGRISVGR
jgi:transposase